MFIGVDIGTSSVRSYADNYTSTVPIYTRKSSQFITQSSKQIYGAIIETLPPSFKSADPTITFTATCSMVVRRLVEIDGTKYLVPFDCGDGTNSDDDVILWMDTRAKSQCNDLNNTPLKRTVSKFIPELGLAKLRWLSDTVSPSIELYCFELFDWFNYIFLVGYYGHNDLVPFKLNDTGYVRGNAIDGSIKGWCDTDLAMAGIQSHIHVGKSETCIKVFDKLPYLGDPLGPMSPQISSNGWVNNGCIDAYSGWVSTITNNREGVVSMIAGTSTCFTVETSCCQSIDGIWGPFEILQGKFTYSCGQPATGKLFEDLFQEYKHLNPDFDSLETRTRALEEAHHQSINELIKHYFYYGDKYGNRSPLNSFNMHEMIIDGKNSPQSIGSVFGTDWTSCIIKYNLILEFLCFQTKDILLRIDHVYNTHTIIVSGLQAKNQRFLKLLHLVTNKNILVLRQAPGLAAAYGAMKIAQNRIGQDVDYETMWPRARHDNLQLQQAVLSLKQQSLYHIIDLETKLNNLYNV